MRVRCGQSRSETISTAPAAKPRRDGEREQRRRLHLHRPRAPAPASRAPLPRGRHRRGRWRPPVRARSRRRRRSVSGSSSAGSPETRSPAPRPRLVPSALERLGDDEQLTEHERGVQRAAGPDPDHRPRSEVVQLRDHDRRAGATHAGALDGQRLAVGRRARVAPQAAVVVEHLRRLEQRLGQPQRAPGIAGEQNALGQGRGGVQMDRRAHEVGEDRRGSWRPDRLAQ